MKAIINGNYTKVLFATFITRFGDSIDSIAFSWLVYVMTGSRALMGAIFAISILPNIIVLPFGGVLADVFNKKTITVYGDLLRALSVTLLALFFFFNLLEVWHLFVFVSINSLFESFANPARSGLLPNIIEQEDYIKGSSWLGTASQFGSLIGLGIASVLIGLLGIWGTILVDGVTFIVSAILIALMTFEDKRQKVEQKPKVKDYFVLIGEGITYLRSKRVLLGFIFLAAYLNFAIVPLNVLRPIYVTEVLQLGVEGLSYIGMSLLVGMIVGGYFMGVKGRNIQPIKAIGVGLTIISLMYMLLGVPGYTTFTSNINIIFVITSTFLLGFFLPVVNAPMQAVIMRTTAPEMIGRLSSIIGVISLCAMPLGGVFVSLIGDSVSVSMMFIIMGLSGVVVTMLFWMKNRQSVFS